jgi:hypothetical protein
MIDGVIAHEVVLEDTVSTELLGAGDFLRPWAGQEEPQLLGKQVRWQVLADAHPAVLGRPFGLAAVRYPEINGVLMDRLCARAATGAHAGDLPPPQLGRPPAPRALLALRRAMGAA